MRECLRKRKWYANVNVNGNTICYCRVVRELTPKIAGKMFKWSLGGLSALHEGTEARMITILEKANLAAIHAGRVTLMAKDIQLAMKLSDATINYKTTESVMEVQPEEKEEAENRRKKEIANLKRKKNEDGSVTDVTGEGVSGTKKNKKSASGVSIITPFSAIVSAEEDSEEEIVIRRTTKRKQIESSDESDVEIETPIQSVRCSKKLTKEQFDLFVQMESFTDELVTIVIDEGWDRVDIENYVLLYNHSHGTKIPLPNFDRVKDTYVNKEQRKKNRKDGNSTASQSAKTKGKDGKKEKEKENTKDGKKKENDAKKEKEKTNVSRSKGGDLSNKGGGSGKGGSVKGRGGESGDVSEREKSESSKQGTMTKKGVGKKSKSQKDSGRKKKKNDLSSVQDEPIVHVGLNEVGALYREGRKQMGQDSSGGTDGGELDGGNPDGESGDAGDRRGRTGWRRTGWRKSRWRVW